jgi:hypothetical protein
MMKSPKERMKSVVWHRCSFIGAFNHNFKFCRSKQLRKKLAEKKIYVKNLDWLSRLKSMTTVVCEARGILTHGKNIVECVEMGGLLVPACLFRVVWKHCNRTTSGNYNNNSNNSATGINRFPRDILSLIFLHLLQVAPHTVCTCLLVCSHWRTLILECVPRVAGDKLDCLVKLIGLCPGVVPLPIDEVVLNFWKSLNADTDQVPVRYVALKCHSSAMAFRSAL